MLPPKPPYPWCDFLAMLPSIKALETAFPGHGKELRKALEMKRSQLAQHPAGAARIAECYHSPETHDVRSRLLKCRRNVRTHYRTFRRRPVSRSVLRRYY